MYEIEFNAETMPGLSYGEIRFESPTLGVHRCPIIRLGGREAGPRLCVMGGIHINEASSIEAAATLAGRIDPAALRGEISIIPVVSTHNLYKFTLVTPPSKGRDLHWSYPGRIGGTFNEALAYALVMEWANGADALLDLHGGDLDERMARYVVVQLTGDCEFDERVRDIAACFECRFVVALAPEGMEEQGRCCSALASQKRLALVAEAGDFGTTDPESVCWHQDGILRVAAHLGILDNAPPRQGDPEQTYLERYEWITAPVGGIVRRDFVPGDWLDAGEVIGRVADLHGRDIATIEAPASGFVMMQKTTQLASEGYWIGSLGLPGGGQPIAEGHRRRTAPVPI